jgi:tight adherence protein C
VTIILPLLAFLFASLLVAAAAMMLAPGGAAAVERRLSEVAGNRGLAIEERQYLTTFVDTLKKVGNAAPRSVSETSTLRKKLIAAGYRGQEALTVFFGLRLAFAIAVFVVAATLFRGGLVVSLGACGIGYVVPGMMLGRLAKRRQHRIRLGLPDALDLLVVSVEAGLGLDQAIQRVADELGFAHIDLANELRLVNLELRAGTARVDALRNLGERTGVDDVVSLVAMLIQTDKFGTSVAQSLRVHSDTVRTKRRQRAEEAAAKTGVKMVFPLVFCIFPAIWVVTIGPAALKFIEVLFPLFRQQ